MQSNTQFIVALGLLSLIIVAGIMRATSIEGREAVTRTTNTISSDTPPEASQDEAPARTELRTARVESVIDTPTSEERTMLKKMYREFPPRRRAPNTAYSEEEMVSLIVHAGLGHRLLNVLKRSMCESSWIPTRVDYKTGTHIGLLQISIRNAERLGYHKADLYDPVTNLRIAQKLLIDNNGKWDPLWSESDACMRTGPPPYYNWRWLKAERGP